MHIGMDAAIEAFDITSGDFFLGEGCFVRRTNDLYRAYGTGRLQKLRNGHAKVEFHPSVFMSPPYRPENRVAIIDQRIREVKR